MGLTGRRDSGSNKHIVNLNKRSVQIGKEGGNGADVKKTQETPDHMFNFTLCSCDPESPMPITMKRRTAW